MTWPWSTDTGTLPDGLVLSSTTGTISGTPTKSGSYTIGVKATNSEGFDTVTFTLTIAGAK